MKVYCKRTYFEKNFNTFQINGKEYGEEWSKWIKGRYYSIRLPNDYEKKFGIYYILESEREFTWSPIKKSDFHKYFIDIDELRNEKILRIIKN